MQKNIQINKQDILFKELSSVFLDSFSIDNLIDKIDIKILIKKKKKTFEESEVYSPRGVYQFRRPKLFELKKSPIKKNNFLFNKESLYNLSEQKNKMNKFLNSLKLLDLGGININFYSLSYLTRVFAHLGSSNKVLNIKWAPFLLGTYYNTSLINLNYSITFFKLLSSNLLKIFSSFKKYFHKLFIFDKDIFLEDLKKLNCFFNNNYYFSTWIYGFLTNTFLRIRKFPIFVDKISSLTESWRRFIYGIPILSLFTGLSSNSSSESLLREFNIYRIPIVLFADSDMVTFYDDYVINTNTKILTPRYFYLIVIYKLMQKSNFLKVNNLAKNYENILQSLYTKNTKAKIFQIKLNQSYLVRNFDFRSFNLKKLSLARVFPVFFLKKYLKAKIYPINDRKQLEQRYYKQSWSVVNYFKRKMRSSNISWHFIKYSWPKELLNFYFFWFFFRKKNLKINRRSRVYWINKRKLTKLKFFIRKRFK